MNSFRQKLEQLKGRRDQALASLEKAEKEVDRLTLEAVYCEEAQTIIQNVAQLTQKELEFHVSELVTLAMSGVFDNPYELVVEFVLRRNRTECDVLFRRDEKLIDPMNSSGGGAVDVAAFALRVALWSLSPDRTQNVLILDEPLKWLKGGELPKRGALMLQEIANRVGLQIIMVSHVPDQIEGADKRIEFKIKNGKSVQIV